MNKEKQKDRISLSLIFAVIVLIFLIISLGVALALGFILMETGVIIIEGDTSMSMSQGFLFLSGVSLIIGALLATLAGKFPLKPVNRIITQLNRLASGDFKARLEFKGPIGKLPAVREACDSFNTMAKELEATELLRSDFINNFSHEFKTPIVSIAGFAKLLKKGNLSDEQQREYIDIIEQESLRLSQLATNIMNLTKYENQSILTDVTSYNLSEQIRSSIVELEGKWERKNINFNLDFSEHEISANKDMLKHVWLNLIDNAVKFSPENEAVDISIKEVGDSYTVAIGNKGEEIPEEKRKRIFNKFYQADESHAKEGNGIGLSLAKGVVELHGGEITVSCDNSTVTFTVNIPKER